MKPNILFIFTDQQRAGALGASGTPGVNTPHADALAAAGVRFERSYCASPLCTPSRAALATGCMPLRCGVTGNNRAVRPGIPQLGELMRAAGYETAWAGKWHVPGEYPVGPGGVPGFEVIPLPGRRLDRDAYPVRIEGREGFWEHNIGAYVDEPVAEAAAAFLRAPRERPFLLTVGFMNPHDICFPPAYDRAGELDGASLPPLPANHAPSEPEPDLVKAMRFTHEGFYCKASEGWDERGWRRALALYHRFTEMADRCVGVVLGALREAGLEEQTVVIFTSDHGEGAGSHRWMGKLSLYEESAGVPFIVSWKGRTEPGRVDRRQLVSGIDVVPTILGFAGADPPAAVEGRSLVPAVESPDAPAREGVVCALYPAGRDADPAGGGRMFRTSRFKYNAFASGALREQLFDLEDDPGEMRNLAVEGARAAELERHRRMLRDWLERNDDPFRPPA